MTRRAGRALIAGTVLVALLGACAAVAPVPSVPPKHPEELGPWRPDCAECHSDLSTGALKPYSTFTHSSAFIREHAAYAVQGQNLCASCHAPGFCQGCHAVKEELKPNVKMGDRPDMTLPHRGDYLVQHRIDGRLDPGSCFPCHGNRNDARCRACHR